MTSRSFNTECPICLETLFDENGLAERDVAEIFCPHLVHSDCLASAGRALNADGARYGMGGFGARAGCPVCETPVSSWRSYHEIEMFKAFWTNRIETALKELETIGEDGLRLPVPGKALRRKLKEDSSLNEKQRKMVRCSTSQPYDDDNSGFLKCLAYGGKADYTRANVYFSRFLFTRGIWSYNRSADTVWLWEWGIGTSSSFCQNCLSRQPGLKICVGCKDSSEAPMYCNRNCQLRDWNHHKIQCKTFQIMKRGGTNNELLERLRAIER